MKKLLLVTIVVLGFATAAMAQPRAIGGRVGYGLEFSYQHGLGDANMIQLDAGFPGFFGFGAAATYDWIFNINGGWNWFAGVGGGVGLYDFIDPLFFVGAAGRIGVEYNFDFPLQLSVDWRPIVGPYFYDGGVGFNPFGLWYGSIASGVRYRF